MNQHFKREENLESEDERYTPIEDSEDHELGSQYFTCNEHSDDALDDILSKLKIPEDRPYHVISISGGTEKKESFDDSLKRNLLLDLEKIFSNEQETLILTSGVDHGVVHYVGEALKRQEWSKTKTTMCLGILTKDIKRLFQSLRSPVDSVMKSSKGGDLNETVRKYANKQHTHFLIVESREEDLWYQKGRFIRKRLQEYLAEAAANAKAEDRSIVLLCVGGGVETIKEIADCLRCKYPIPVVLFKGSGGATDFVDYIISESQELICKRHSEDIFKKMIIEKFREDLYDRVESYRGELSGEMEDDVWKDIAEILRFSESLTSYDYRNKIHGAAVHDFSAVVRQAAETSKVYEESVGAKEIILKAIARVQSNRTSDEKFTPQASKREEQIEKRMLRALRSENMRGITDLFSEDFRATINVNKQIIKERREMKDASGTRKRNQEEHGDERLTKFLNKYNKMLPDEEEANQLSFRNIFLWAIETRRFLLAEFAFSKLQEDAVIASLVVSIGFRKVAKTMPSQRHTEHEKYMCLSREYESKATRLIEIGHEQDPGEVETLLLQRHKYWRNFTCLKVAIRGKAKMFLSFDCCQKTLRKQWYGHIDTILFERKVVLATPFYWIFANADWIKIDGSEDPTRKKGQDTDDAISSTKQPEEGTSQPESQPQNNGSGDAKMTVRDKVGRYLKKCKAFYSSPIANFAMHCVSYFMFLLLYAYVLTFSHLGSTFPLADFVAHVWILAILIEIARAMFNLYSPEQNFSRRKHFKEWSKFTWNRLAMAAMVTSIVAFLCRWFTATRLLGRICYGVNYALFAFRVLRLYSATEVFGPWVSMIKHMLFTTFKFTIIFMVFLVGYGVAIQALLGEHSGEGISFLAVRDIFYKPYFQVFGELFLDDIPGGRAVYPDDSMATNVCEHKDIPSQNFVTYCLSRYVREEEQRQLFSIEAKTGRLERASGYIWEQNQTIIESARAIDSKSSALAGATSEIKYGTSELKEHTFGIQRDTSRLLDYNKKAKKSAVKLQKGQEDIASKMQLLEEHLQEWEDKSVKLPTLAETQDQLVSKVVEGVVAKLSPGIYKNDDTRSRPREDSGIVASPGSSFTSDPPRVAGNDSVFVRMSGDNVQNEDDFDGAGGDPNITSELKDVKTNLSNTRANRTSKRRSEKRDPAESPKRRHRERSDEAKKKRRKQKRNIVSSSPSSDTDSETATDRRKRGKHSAGSERRKSGASDMHDSIKLTPDLHKKLKTSPIVASIHYYWGIGPSGNIEQIGRIKSGPQFSKFH
ncbi:transient receptor potential cation channel subfamily M member 5-like [Ptychodera flava]|uniref:transient receptor potential cation channel subfamily M member 5-like n=1 Tax=Ptychodera flava TaxID=63121 RepID=UPI00396A2A35